MPPSTYAFVGRRGPRLTLVSLTTGEGARAVCVFDDPLAAEAFLVVEGLGREWKVVEHPPRKPRNCYWPARSGARGTSRPTLRPRSPAGEPDLVHIGAFVKRLRGSSRREPSAARPWRIRIPRHRPWRRTRSRGTSPA